jgi:hypothetical protein
MRRCRKREYITSRHLPLSTCTLADTVVPLHLLVDEDCENFRKEFVDLMRVTALCLAGSTGYGTRFKCSPDAKESFLKCFGVDLEKVGNEEYKKEHIQQRMGSLEAAFDKLVRTLDYIEKI